MAERLTRESSIYKTVALAVESGQPISEIRGLSEDERRCLEAIMGDRRRARVRAAHLENDSYDL